MDTLGIDTTTKDRTYTWADLRPTRCADPIRARLEQALNAARERRDLAASALDAVSERIANGEEAYTDFSAAYVVWDSADRACREAYEALNGYKASLLEEPILFWLRQTQDAEAR